MEKNKNEKKHYFPRRIARQMAKRNMERDGRRGYLKKKKFGSVRVSPFQREWRDYVFNKGRAN